MMAGKIRQTFLICFMAPFAAAVVAAEPQGNQTIMNFTAAKKILWEIYSPTGPAGKNGYLHEFYCDCGIAGRNLDSSSCGYQPQHPTTKKGKKNPRAYRIEWEHIVPASLFGSSFAGWSQKAKFKECKGLSSRVCAAKVHPEFARMEADLYNLIPVIGELNALRSDFPVGEIAGEKRVFGKCDVEIEEGKYEPMDSMRGDIARTYFYMDETYPGRGIVTAETRKMLEQWSRDDPPTIAERARSADIMRIQGNCNRFVAESCSDAKTPDAKATPVVSH